MSERGRARRRAIIQSRRKLDHGAQDWRQACSQARRGDEAGAVVSRTARASRAAESQPLQSRARCTWRAAHLHDVRYGSSTTTTAALHSSSSGFRLSVLPGSSRLCSHSSPVNRAF